MKYLLASLILLFSIAAASASGLVPEGEQSFYDANGNPLTGGQVYMYVPGTTTPKNTWQDPNLTTLNTNPIVLDASGRARIWAASGAQFRQVVQDSDGNLIWDQPAYTPGSGNGTVTGPTTTVVGHLAIWNDTTGTTLADTSSPTLTGVTINPTASSFAPGFSIAQSVAGSAASSDTYLNSINISSDTAYLNNKNIFGLGVQYTCCGSTAQGQRFGIGSRMYLTGTSDAADPLPAYTALLGQVYVRGDTSATDATATAGNSNIIVGDTGAVTGWTQIIGHEIDVTVEGSSIVTKAGLDIVLGAGDDTRGGTVDAAMWFVNAGSVGWNSLMLLDATQGGASPIAAAGSVLSTRGTPAFTNGFDFTNASISNKVLIGPSGTSYITGNGIAYFNYLNMPTVGIPAPPADGWYIYTNTATGELQAKSSGGTVRVLALP